MISGNTGHITNRDSRIDIIRIIAVLSVIGIHFFLNTGYYEIPVNGSRMYVATVLRTFFMVCVPLFLLITGYLMNRKTISDYHFFGILKVIGAYMICFLFELIYYKVGLNTMLTLDEMKNHFFHHYDYSWYIGMYIGFYFMLPFLNLVYNNLNEKYKTVLLLICFVNTILPEFAESIFPNYWVAFYPISYYYLGAYIFEHEDLIISKKLINPFVLLVAIIVFGTYNFYKSYKVNFIVSTYNSWGSFENTVDSVLLFCILLKYKRKKLVGEGKKLLSCIANLVIYIYLFSWIADKIIYPIFLEHVPDFYHRLPYIFIIVPVNFMLSFLMALIANSIYTCIQRGYKKYKYINDSEKEYAVIIQAICVGIIVAFVYRVSITYDLGDEVQNLVMGYRVVLGQKPLIDIWEIFQTGNSYIAPFIYAFRKITGSTEGVVLFSRIIYFLVNIMTAVHFYKVFKDDLPKNMLWILNTVIICIAPFSLYYIWYDTASVLLK